MKEKINKNSNGNRKFKIIVLIIIIIITITTIVSICLINYNKQKSKLTSDEELVIECIKQFKDIHLLDPYSLKLNSIEIANCKDDLDVKVKLSDFSSISEVYKKYPNYLDKIILIDYEAKNRLGNSVRGNIVYNQDKQVITTRNYMYFLKKGDTDKSNTYTLNDITSPSTISDIKIYVKPEEITKINLERINKYLDNN